MNNKGFAISGVLYSILIIFVASISIMLYNLQNKKTVLDQIKTDTVKAVNFETSIDYLTEKINNLEEIISQGGVDGITIRYNEETDYVQVYQNSEWKNWKKAYMVNGITKVEAKEGETHKGIVYLDPTDLTNVCDETNSVSSTGTKTGCMKWYIFAEDDNSYKLILNHNTTATVVWNSSGSNSSMNEVKTALTKDVSLWESSIKASARLITADEVAAITGNTTFNSSTSNSDSGFYFETNTSTVPSPYAGTYSWLYDYTSDCTSYGCSIADSSTYGYWTSTPVVGSTNYAWYVRNFASLIRDSVSRAGVFGVRPVITISKSIVP
jgi:hypothetical protein